MCRHETKYCPRCTNSFECKQGTITECQCFGVELNEKMQAMIAKEFSDCLCRNCLLELRNRSTENNLQRDE